MEFGWNEAQQQRRKEFALFGETYISPNAAERDSASEFHGDGWKQLARAGFWTPLSAPEADQSGDQLWEFLAGLEGLASAADDSGFVLSAVAHAGLMYVLSQHGTAGQRERILPTLAAGALGATAATEPHGGSHVAAVRTSATPAGQRQDTWLLNGSKSHITNAPQADHMLVVGRIPSLGKRDITLFVLDRGRDGLTTGAHEDLLGQRTSPTGTITMNDVPVTAEDLVGPPGDGLTTLYSFLAFDRLMYGIVVAAILEHALPPTIERINTRQTFGTKLADHEMIQDKIVLVRQVIESSRILAYAAADALNRGDDSFSTLASAAKLAASEGGVHAATELMQIFGHLGYERGEPHERRIRDALAIRIAGGTTEMQKKNIFKDTAYRYALAGVEKP